MHVEEMRMLRWMCGHTRAIKLGMRLLEGGSGLVVDKSRRDDLAHLHRDMTLDRKEWRSHIKVEVFH
ncbi:hypothetical protein H5410_062678 [Solanum commersonii]|uniref:Uncharacterized protein n=1 Tax=Solanum commersonii TaxID=4109 RepID=A0A9J5WD20_SOLCO|nr:hypothetical protein H5410_062678 [Solanum commersonii]